MKYEFKLWKNLKIWKKSIQSNPLFQTVNQHFQFGKLELNWSSWLTDKKIEDQIKTVSFSISYAA